jgi:hypothetical protein
MVVSLDALTELTRLGPLPVTAVVEASTQFLGPDAMMRTIAYA